MNKKEWNKKSLNMSTQNPKEKIIICRCKHDIINKQMILHNGIGLVNKYVDQMVTNDKNTNKVNYLLPVIYYHVLK